MLIVLTALREYFQKCHNFCKIVLLLIRYNFQKNSEYLGSLLFCLFKVLYSILNSQAEFNTSPQLHTISLVRTISCNRTIHWKC